MAKVAITEQYLEDIADAIRSKTGLSNTYLPSEMAEAILTISGGGGIVPSGTKTINISGAGTTTEDVTQYASASVVVPAGTAGTPTATKSVVSGNKLTVTPGVTNVAGFISGGSIYGTAVQVAASELVSGTLEITTNGTKDVTNYASVEVAVPTGSTINNQDKSVTPTTSQQTITADSGYTGLGTVTVGAMPAMTLPTSADSSATSGYSSKATISRSTADQYINIPTGYNAAGAYYKVSAVPNGTAGTPTATKGTVSNNSVSVTPSVTNTTGYITGSTKTGTAITVSASELVSGNKSITSNGNNIDVTNYATVSVNVSGGGGTPTIDSLTVTPTESEQTYNSSSVDGYKPVTVGAISSTYVGSGIVRRINSDLSFSGGSFYGPSGYYENNLSKNISVGSVPTPSISVSSAGLITAVASLNSDCWIAADSKTNTSQLTTQAAKTVTPTESEQNAVAANVYTTGIVKVGAISSTYIGSGITQRDSDDLTASGATITAPAGYYATAASKSVTTMTLPTSAASSATSGYTSKATISRSTSAQYINIPPGYNSAGGYYLISAIANGSASAPSTISGTSATISTGTNTLTLTKTVSVTPVVSAGYVSSGTATNSSVSLTASVTTKAAATITPSTTNQTIAAGTYLTGIQTIAGDADLVGSNIVSGASIFGVNGTVVLQNFYTGSSAPSSSTGSNGDIYLQT